MKEFGLLLMVLSLSSALFGCGIEPALSGRAYDEYQKSIKSSIHYWKKDGMTEGGRKRDWVACGGMANGNYSSDAPSGSTTEAILRSAARKKKAIGECMSAKGYRR